MSKQSPSERQAEHERAAERLRWAAPCEPTECHKTQSRLIVERDEAIAKLEASEARTEDYIRRLDTERNRVAFVESERDAAISGLASLNAQLDMWQVTTRDLDAKFAASEARCNQLTKQTWELGSEIEEGHHKMADDAAKLTESEATVARLTAENSILRKAIVGTRAEVDEVKYLRLVDWETVARLRVELERAEEFVERLVSKGMWAMHTSVELTEGGIALVMVELDRQAVRLELLAKIRDTIVNGLVAIEEKYREDRKAEKA